MPCRAPRRCTGPSSGGLCTCCPPAARGCETTLLQAPQCGMTLTVLTAAESVPRVSAARGYRQPRVARASVECSWRSLLRRAASRRWSQCRPNYCTKAAAQERKPHPCRTAHAVHVRVLQSRVGGHARAGTCTNRHAQTQCPGYKKI